MKALEGLKALAGPTMPAAPPAPAPGAEPEDPELEGMLPAADELLAAIKAGDRVAVAEALLSARHSGAAEEA
jgi:hypothetical protein